MKTKQVNLKNFPVEWYKRLQELAKANRRSVTQEVFAAVEFYLKEKEREQQKK
ncbi:MAG: hypothetical protein HY257_04680 [Chloroflexi bacterium]|nr:hypothetical protein [Chloroflexota bacterium]